MDFQEQLKMRLKKRAESSDQVLGAAASSEPKAQRERPTAGKPPPLEPMSFEEQLKNRLKKRSEEQSTPTSANAEISLKKAATPTGPSPFGEGGQAIKPSALKAARGKSQSVAAPGPSPGKPAPAQSPTVPPTKGAQRFSGQEDRKHAKEPSATPTQPSAAAAPAMTESASAAAHSVEPSTIGSAAEPAGPQSQMLPQQSADEQVFVVTEEMLVVVLADYQATDDEQLGLTSGETVVMLIEDYGNGWAYGCSLDGARRGMFPQTFVEKAKK
ncbi:hypothetical protein HK105_206918 [Polyrhizophydium stewartii]|uniref:SH3 domain-containing protein n=1 Tax=Polyrhizophydium stewartii TaxID=2732419 RepID=A0ABR4N258_9FUNG